MFSSNLFHVIKILRFGLVRSLVCVSGMKSVSVKESMDIFQKSVESDEKGVTSEAAVKGMPVDDVSSLVRKKAKRVAEDEPKEEAKRARSDNAQADNVQSLV